MWRQPRRTSPATPALGTSRCPPASRLPNGHKQGTTIPGCGDQAGATTVFARHPPNPSVPGTRLKTATLLGSGLRGSLIALVGVAALSVATASMWFGAFTGSTSTAAIIPPATEIQGDRSPSQPSEPTMTDDGNSKVEFVSPQEGLVISPRQNVVVSGTVTGLGSNTLWILSKHEIGGSFYLVLGEAGVSPVIIKDGPWSVTDEGVGNPSDKGSAIVYYAVQANAECSRTLSAKQNYDSFHELPTGCTILQGQREVHIK